MTAWDSLNVWLLTRGVCCHGDQGWIKGRAGRVSSMYGYLVMVCVVMVTRTDEGKGRSSEQYVWLLSHGVCCHGDQD